MALYPSWSWRAVVASFCFCFLSLFSLSSFGRPATFLQDFRVTWSDSHIRQIDGGRAIQLVLDQNSGCGFASKQKYLFGRVSMKIKLIPGDSAGTVTAFYMNSDTDTVRDELDFEFLGNRTGQPYTVQTNIYAHGKGDREQRVNLWFDPAADFHTYTILWNHHHIVFYVDDVPIRVYKNNEAKGVPYPKLQPMGVILTLRDAVCQDQPLVPQAPITGGKALPTKPSAPSIIEDTGGFVSTT
ncbi:unnamed protein product [Malus baccata var. baccata]